MANTALAVCRGGCAWSVTVVDVTPGGVQASIAGAGTGAATIEACDAGGAERVSLDVAGETAAITCSGTGSMTATAVRASPTIELRAPASGPAVVINLATGDTATVGSPVTASSDNLEPILVELVDAADVPFGGFELDPGESVDVTFSPAGTGNLTVLVGTVTVGIGGGTATLGPGQSLAFLAADPGTALANLATQVGQLLASGAIRNAGDCAEPVGEPPERARRPAARRPGRRPGDAWSAAEQARRLRGGRADHRGGEGRAPVAPRGAAGVALRWWGLLDAAAAVHLDAGSGQHRGVVRGEEEGRLGNVLRGVESPERDRRDVAGPSLLVDRWLPLEGRQHRRLRGDGRQRDDADPERREIEREGLRQRDDGALRRRVALHSRAGPDRGLEAWAP